MVIRIYFCTEFKQFALGVSLMVLLFSCKRFVLVPPPETELILENVFQDDGTALSAIAEIYGQMSVESFATGGSSAISFFEGVYADELTAFTASDATAFSTFYQNAVLPSNQIVSDTWTGIYNVIYKANRILEGLNTGAFISPALKRQLQGEALFVRAFCHFYLVNLFGEVPLVISSDYRINTTIFRSPIAAVYTQMIADLRQAQDLLSENYPSIGRVRPNKYAALALLSRIYLYSNDFENAEATATDVINNNSYKLSDSLNTVFLKTSEEAIWQLLPYGGRYEYTSEGRYFILVAPPTFVSLRKAVVDAFESGDLRRKYWVDSLVSTSGITKWYYPFKYKENNNNGAFLEASTVLRLSEQYLIRAEARANKNNLTGSNSAVADLDTLRLHRGLGAIAAATKDEVLAAIEKERQSELFTEWGHRFFDLKRWHKLDAVLGSIKSNWNSTDSLLPIPQSEILANANLTQNQGYN